MEMIAASQLYLLLAALGVGLTLIALVGRGLYVWGRLSRQVDGHGEQIDDLGSRINTVEARLSNVEIRLGNVETRLAVVETKVDELDRKVDELNRKVDTLITEVQQLNRMMVALANHRHDQDGNIVFTLPPD